MYQPNFRFLNLQFQICIKILQFPLCWLAFASVYVYTMVCQSSLLKNSWICLLSILRKEPLEGLYFILVSCKYIFHACWSSRVQGVPTSLVSSLQSTNFLFWIKVILWKFLICLLKTWDISDFRLWHVSSSECKI